MKLEKAVAVRCSVKRFHKHKSMQIAHGLYKRLSASKMAEGAK